MSDADNDERERTRRLMMAALDGEISPAERRELERLLAGDAALRAEWQRFEKVKEVTRAMSYKRPPDETWDRYFESVYNRLERGIGWLLVSLGVIVLAGWGLWELVHDVLADTALAPIVKVGVFAVLLGGAILAVSVLRERLFVRKTDPYKEVRR